MPPDMIQLDVHNIPSQKADHRWTIGQTKNVGHSTKQPV